MAFALTLLMTVVAAFHVAVFLAWYMWFEDFPRLRAEPPAALPEQPPLVSILIPARNEQEDITDCLRGAFAQDYPNYEVIVANDNSTDGTAGLIDGLADEAASRGVSFTPLHLTVHPEGWAGKNYALDQAYRQARGEYLLCIDADTVPQPRMLRQAMAYVIGEGVDLLTIVPRPVIRGFWDRVANGFILLMGVFMGLHKINDERSPEVNANGPFMLFSRKGYEGIGGHAAIAGEVWEDAILAERIKQGGFRLRYLFATELMDVKLYGSLRELLDGWAKIEYRKLELGRSKLWQEYAVVGFLFVFYLLPWLIAALELSAGLLGWLEAGSFWLLGPSLVSVVAIGYTVKLVARYLDIEGGLSPWLNWLGAGVSAYLLLRTAYRFKHGLGAKWKGSEYKAG